MEQTLETCELCGTEKSGTYTLFGISILGAALCPSYQKIAKTKTFLTELAHLLNTGQGDLEKFVRKDIIPKCRYCNTELDKTNWFPSDKRDHNYRCTTCFKHRRNLLCGRIQPQEELLRNHQGLLLKESGTTENFDVVKGE